MKHFSLIMFYLIAAFAISCGSSSSNPTPVISSSSKAITAFSFTSPSATGVVTESSHTIAITVPYATDVTALVATFTTTGASVIAGSTEQVSGTTANDFTTAQTYTVTAADSSTQDYVVTVTIAPDSAKAITAFSFASPAATGVVTESSHTIAITVPNATDVTALVATFTTTGASVKVGSTVQVSGTTANDFTTAKTYTVTAADSTTQDYTVTVTALALVIDIYVSTTGNDTTGDGSITTPYLTISKAVTIARTSLDKFVIAVAAGTYNTSFTISIVNPESDGVKVYGGYNSDFSARDAVNRTNPTYQTKIVASGFNGYAVSINSADNAVFDGFTIELSITNTDMYYTYIAGENNTFSNNTITVTGTQTTSGMRRGLLATGDGYLIKNNIIDFSGATMTNTAYGMFYGIEAQTGTTIADSTGTVQNNTVKMPAWSGSANTANWAGIVVLANTISRTTVAKDNTIICTNPNNSGISFYGMRIQNHGNAGDKAYIVGNTITGAGLVAYSITGIETNTVLDTMIANNTIKMSSGANLAGYSGAIVWQNQGTGWVYNNTIDFNVNGNATFICGVAATSATGNPVVKNNIIVLSNTGTPTRFAGVGNPFAGAIATVTNNFIYTNKAEVLPFSYDVTNYYGTVNDPLLDADMKLQASSPTDAKTGGVNLYADSVYLQTDKGGAARPSTGAWAIGAYVAP
jgi:hypothetical protein